MDCGGDWGVGGGILTVADIVCQHRHAVTRDLNELGYKSRHALIEADEFVSIVLAAQPGTALRYSAEGGWSQSDHLLANLAEQQAGLTDLPHRYARPGSFDEPEAPMPVSLTGTPQWSAQTREEFEARKARDQARGAELAATEQKQPVKH